MSGRRVALRTEETDIQITLICTSRTVAATHRDLRQINKADLHRRPAHCLCRRITNRPRRVPSGRQELPAIRSTPASRRCTVRIQWSAGIGFLVKTPPRINIQTSDLQLFVSRHSWVTEAADHGREGSGPSRTPALCSYCDATSLAAGHAESCRLDRGGALGHCAQMTGPPCPSWAGAW